MEHNILAIIPARKGSKRLPGKNMLDFFGKPLVAWTIEASLASKLIDHVLVSTDDDRVAQIAQDYGVMMTGLRPANLSTDTVSLIDVVRYHVNAMDKTPDYVMLLQPTSPLRQSAYIDEAVAMLDDGADAVISVTRAQKPSQWQFALENDSNDLSSTLNSSVSNKQSQEYAPEYCFNGAIYIAKTSRLLDEQTFILSSRCKAYEMPIEASTDIDTHLDLLIAKALYLGVKNASKKLDQ